MNPLVQIIRCVKFRSFLLLAALGVQLSSHSQVLDVTGTWNDVGFVIKSFSGSVTIHVTNEDAFTGSFSGYDGGNFPVTGIVTNTDISFFDPGVFGNGSFSGIILSNGMAGGNGYPGYLTEVDTGGRWYGYWAWFPNTGLGFVQYSAPVFTLQPLSLVISAGTPATFSAGVSGHPTPTLQWQFNGTDIPGATNSSLSIDVTTVTNLGMYDLVASNVLGTNTSRTASLSFLDIRCIPGLIIFGPVGEHIQIQENATLGSTNWIPITNIVLTSAQPYVWTDPSAITNASMMYRYLPSPTSP
jgi:hypothetical protein